MPTNYQSGGAFLPEGDYNVKGQWNFEQDPTFGASGTGAIVTTTGTQTLTNKTLTAPVLTTPDLGVASATSVNKVALTAPATSATLALVDGTTVTGPAATGTIATLAGTETLTNKTITAAVIPDWKVLAATATYTSTTTPATLTGFSWTVVAGTYIFEVNLPATMTTNGGLTVNFLLTTAVLTSVQYQTYAATAADNTTAVSTTGTTTTSGTKVFDSKTAAYTGVQIRGSMVVGTGGTFAWQGCQNTSAGGGDITTVLLGSYAKMTRVA